MITPHFNARHPQPNSHFIQPRPVIQFFLVSPLPPSSVFSHARLDKRGVLENLWLLTVIYTLNFLRPIDHERAL